MTRILWLGLILAFLFVRPGVCATESHEEKTETAAHPQPEKQPTPEELQKLCKYLSNDLLQKKTWVTSPYFPNINQLPPNVRATQLERLKHYRDTIQNLIQLAKEGVIKPGSVPQIDFQGESFMVPDFYEGVFIDNRASLKELRAFFEKLPTKTDVSKSRESFDQGVKKVQRDTGIVITPTGQVSFGGWGGAHGDQFLSRKGANQALETIQKEMPDILPKSVAKIDINYFGQSKYEPRDKQLRLDYRVTPEALKKLLDTIPDSPTPSTFKELAWLKGLTQDPGTKRALDRAVDTLNQDSVEIPRGLNKLRQKFQDRFGFPIIFNNPGEVKPVQQLALYAGFLALPKNAMKPNRGVRDLLIVANPDPGLTVSGRMCFKLGTPAEKIVEAINATSDKATLDKMMEKIDRREGEVGKMLGDGAGISLDSGLIDHQQALTAIDTLEKIAKAGYRLKAPAKQVFLTGSQVKGWKGARSWDGSGKLVVVRSDFALEDLKPFLTKDNGTLAELPK